MPEAARSAATTPRAADVPLANAPCSYGAFELTVDGPYDVPGPEEVLDHVARAGYAGIDLGPLGYLGTPAQLRERLHSRDLALAGGYLALPFSDAEGFERALPRLEALLDTFDAVGGRAQAHPPRPTLADEGSDERAARPGQAVRDRSLGLDERGWQVLARNVAAAQAMCRARGYEPTFHHHTATYVEAPWEVDRLLELTDIGLCFDTGHLLVGGGQPVEALGAWMPRVDHLQLKDARRAIVEQVVAERAGVEEIWRRGAFCPLGAGDVDVYAVLDIVRSSGYRGWLIVEQDMIRTGADAGAEAARDQAANLDYLRARGF